MGLTDNDRTDLKPLVEKLIVLLECVSDLLNSDSVYLPTDETKRELDYEIDLSYLEDRTPKKEYLEFLDTVKEEITEQGLVTNDMVNLEETRRLKLNGKHLDLTWREYILLLILSRQCLSGAGEYISVHEIIDRIPEEIQRLTPCGKSGVHIRMWTLPSYDDVHKVVHGLRVKIARDRGNPNLIESGPRGDGYRLSTPAMNVTIPQGSPGDHGEADDRNKNAGAD